MAHAAFNWQDPFLLDQQLTEDERMVREAAQAYCQDKLLPRVTEAFRNSHTDVAIFVKWVSWVCSAPRSHRSTVVPV